MLLTSAMGDRPEDGTPENEACLEDAASAADDILRRVVRAIGDLRGGGVVVLRDVGTALALAAAESAGEQALARLRRWTTGEPLLLRPDGDGDQDGAAQAVPLGGWRIPDGLTALAERSASDASSAPPGAQPVIVAALSLARQARLLPCLVAGTIELGGIIQAREVATIVLDVADVAAFRAAEARLIRVGEASVPLADAASARVVAFRNPASGTEHLAVVVGDPTAIGSSQPAPLVRLHSECFTGDVLGSLRCDCGPQLRAALRRMAAENAGVLLYLAQEGRGIGLVNKLRAYSLQDRGLDTVDANTALGYAPDERDFAVAATMLRSLGVTRLRLLTNNPAKVAALQDAGLVVDRASLLVAANGVNDAYLATKLQRFGHLLG